MFARLTCFSSILASIVLLGGCQQLRQIADAPVETDVHVSGADGRFTIGAGARRLMYGYPVPHSTSHFVLSVDGRQASNNPWFPSSVERLTGELDYTPDSLGSPRSSIRFREFEGIEVTQRLIPVNRSFTDVPRGVGGQYYRIEYDIANNSGRQRNVGLMLLIDTMIDDNDAAQMDADGTRVSTQTSFTGRNIPSELIVWRAPGNRNDLAGSLVTDKGRAVRPDALYVGKWPYFHKTVWSVAVDGATYTDSGILAKWDEAPVAAGGNRYLATHYGLPFGQGTVSALMNSPIAFRRDSANVYFDLGKDILTSEAKTVIDRLLQNTIPAGVFIEVFADAKGDEQANLALSRRRAESVMTYLQSRNISRSIIIPKAFGESLSDQSADARTTGKAEDRRASIVIFTRE